MSDTPGRELVSCMEPLEQRLLLSGATQEEYGFYHFVVDAATGLPGQAAGVRPGGGLDYSPLGYAGPVGMTPAQVRAAYGIEIGGAIVGDGAGQTIVIVDAYDNPAFVSSTDPNYLNSDLHKFSLAFGLPDPPSFLKVDQHGGTNYPAADTIGWAGEIALDVEWAHAMAPAANIVLVEADSAYDSDLILTAVETARNWPGASVVSMSFGRAETLEDRSGIFTTPAGHNGVTFVASTGDDGSPGSYPAYSPYVLAVGGTSLTLSGGAYGSETGWSGSGGGQSTSKIEPAYQGAVQTSGYRQIPDVAFDANPNTGVAVYDSYEAGAATPWLQIGGTSLSAPCWGGLIAIADQLRADLGLGSLDGHSQTLPALYSLPAGDFHDITSGSNGGFSAAPGYDQVTGLGSPRANLLLPALAATAIPAAGAIYSANMNAAPGWTFQGQWAWGAPTGNSGDPASGHTGSNVVGYNLSGSYAGKISGTDFATTAAINCSGRTGVSLEFWRWIGVDGSNQDHANLQVSNNGTTWTTFWQNPAATLVESAWSYQAYDISRVADNQATVYIRWGLGPTDRNRSYAGWNLDDLVVSGSVALAPSAAPAGLGLEAASDSGAPGDNVTNLNNHSPGTALAFRVQGTVPGATVSVYDGATLIGQALAPAGSVTVVTTDGATALSDGAHGLITARQTEPGKAASPASPAMAPALTVDTAAPAAGAPVLDPGSDTGLSSADRITQGLTPLFTGSASDAGSGVWKVVVASDDGKTATDTDSPFYATTLATLDEGSRSVTATVYDLAGNTYTTAALAITVDRTAPAAGAPALAPGSDTGRSDADGITQGANPLFTGSASDAASGIWKVLVASDDGKTATDSASPFYTATLATLDEGSRSVTATVYDVAGNTYTTAALTITVDRTAPAAGAPALDPGSDTGLSDADGITQGLTPLFAGSASDAGSGVWKVLVASDDGKSAADTGSPFYAVALATLNEGVRSVTATVYDVAGNLYTPAPLTVTVDRTAPTASSPALDPGSDTGVSSADRITQGLTPLFTGSASDGGSGVWKVLVASDDGKTAADTGSPFYSAALATLNEGVRSVAATVYDVAGNLYTTAPLTVTVDRTAPTVQAAINSPDPLTGWYNLATGTATISYTWSDGTGSGVVDPPATPCLLGEGASQSAPGVTVHDAAGNASPPTGGFAGIDVDLTAPTATVDPLTTSDANPPLTGTVDDPFAAVAVSIVGQPGGPYEALNHGDGTWSLPAGSLAGPLPRGILDVRVTATDPAGNPSPGPAGAELIVYTLLGDANLDGTVDLQDFGILKDHFGVAGGWPEGDFNADGAIDLQDFGILKDHFGQSSLLTADLGELAQAVPEPATLALTLLAAALTRPRRPRKR